tara:strand:+ start:517 stop:1194 length:678 start_codon:yes stop_codon:yes gene_type:complete
MFQIITVIIFLIYLGLVYRFRNDNIVLLLLTLVAILALCNVKNIVEGQNTKNNMINSLNNNTSKNAANNIAKNNSNSSKNNSAKNNSAKNNSNKNSVNGPKPDDKMRFIVAADYQMGPYDGLVLTLDDPRSKYVKLKDVSLASREDLCTYQGNELPLECDKTLYSGMGPSITGVAGDDQNMFMFYRNKSSPACCPSTYSTSTGCVCTTQDQRDYINRRGMVTANQ